MIFISKATRSWHTQCEYKSPRVTQTLLQKPSLLNDFHVARCHENGHGYVENQFLLSTTVLLCSDFSSRALLFSLRVHRFGLPHTDEDHYNRDRGDCMDYTTRTWNNLKPGDFNLDLLVQLYGTPTNPLTEDPLADGSSAPPTFAPLYRPPPPPPRPWNNKDKEKEEKK